MPEKYLATVPLEVWQAMLRLASDFDLNNDGLYDARSMAINIWVSPTDKPRDWLFKITRGALKYPREYLATINAYRLDDNRVRLTLSVTNYARKHAAESLFYSGRIDYRRYKQMLKLAEQGTQDEWEWAEQKARHLLEQAQRESVFEEIIICPFCGQEFPGNGCFKEQTHKRQFLERRHRS